MDNLNNIEISIIIPFKNEEESLPLLINEVNEAMNNGFKAKWNKNWECILVNDGSDDNSETIAKALIQQGSNHQNFKLINLQKNYGQSAALYIGFQEAKGKYLSMLDADLQNDPQDILKLYNQLILQDVDLMNGFREERQDDFVRRISSKLANGFRNLVTGSSISDVGCSIRVFRRECIEIIPCYKGMHRFLPSLIKLQGYTIAEIPVNHRPRQLGTAKYGISNRLWVGIADTFAMLWMKQRLVFPRVENPNQNQLHNSNQTSISNPQITLK